MFAVLPGSCCVVFLAPPLFQPLLPGRDAVQLRQGPSYSKMLKSANYGRPAGDESDGSSDEWDIGHSSYKTSPDSEVSRVPGDDNLCALKRAIAAGNVDLVQQLLDSGMDVETRLGFGWTPLMYAVHKAHYEMAQMLLDNGASANFSRDDCTVLMVACAAPSTTEEKIAKCVGLLLSRSANPNIHSRSRMTCLMQAARVGYCQVINLLVSHGAELDVQDDTGQTALIIAVRYGHEDAVLTLLQLGANKSLRTMAGKTAADMAKALKQPQVSQAISRILNSSGVFTDNGGLPSVLKERSDKLCDIELLLHGLNLEHLCDIMMENDITWSDLLIMEKEDFEKIGIIDPRDQKTILDAIQVMSSDRVNVDTLWTQLDNIDAESEELYNILISLRRQCEHLTQIIKDINCSFPRSPSELVLTLDPKKVAQGICTEIVAQTGDLQKEVTCLRDLLKKEPVESCAQPSLPESHTSKRGPDWKKLALGILGAGLLLLSSLFKG